MKKKRIWVLLLVSLTFISFNCDVFAATYFDGVGLFTEHNPNFGGTGWFYSFGSIVYDDKYDIQSATARSVTTEDEYILLETTTLTGTGYWNVVEIDRDPWLEQLEIIATNTNGESSSVFTNILDKEKLIDLATNVQISDGSLTPTFSWNPVADAQTYRVRILNSGGERIFDSFEGNISETYFTLPNGVLSPGESYTLRLLAENWDLEDDIQHLENRSSTYMDFQTVPIPSAFLLLTSGLLGLAVLRKKYKKT